MELIELKNKILSAYTGSPEELATILDMVEQDQAIYPFNAYEHLICQLIESGGLNYEQYLDIRTEYVSENPFLWIFEISAPRLFGENFAQTYILGKCLKLKKASKKLDNFYAGEYDLWLDGIKIEVKASRAVDSESNEPLYMKALSRNTQKAFIMNFQQLKPQCCDVFIWVAVFRDEIVVWIMNTKEVLNHTLYSTGQHRGNAGNEGQLHIKHDNIHLFDKYKLLDDNIEKAIVSASKR